MSKSKKIKIGVMGVYRGTSMMHFCRYSDKAELVAVCDKWEEGLERHKKANADIDIAYYTSFDEFIKHDMDAVVIANYANEHAPFAIKALRSGKHVISEVLPCQNMKEAVELVETIEQTGLVYYYAENYCYMSAPYEMKKLYEAGKIGEIEYAECEYVHNCEPEWPSLAYGDPDHWRNTLFSTFYCTHSFGPIRHITGLRPISVIGIEATKNERMKRAGSKSASFGMELITLENGAVVKSLHGGLYKNSIWYSLYGTKGRLESAREDAECGKFDRIYVNADAYEGEYAKEKIETYRTDELLCSDASEFGHGGGDFYTMNNFIARINGDTTVDFIDIYEGLDMALVGMFAYRSILDGSVPKEIPNLRNKEERDKWRNDTACTDPKAAGDMLWPTQKNGTPHIAPEIYEHQKRLWQKDLADEDGYASIVLGDKK